MEMVLSGLTWVGALVFLEDVIIFSRTFEEHMTRLATVLERLAGANLKVHPHKCNLLQRPVTFLDHVVSADGIATDPEKVRAVKEWETPRSISEVRGFAGLCSYYRKIVPGFAQKSAPS
jgi:GR25 family glycosyltransferase involved in LPS biosynthesis